MSRPRTYQLPKVGDRTGKYTVIEEPSNANKVLCRCDCGTIRHITSHHLRNRPNLSCGCDVGERISERKTKHGQAKRGKQTREYIVWTSMMARCYNREVDRYPRYGGRGIVVCESWHSFENFFNDMGKCPSSDYTIGRRDNDGNYEPGNCRWETDEEQANNRSNNVYLEYNGERLSVAQWARRTGLPEWHIHRQKKRGWSDSEILGDRVMGSKQN